MTLRRSTILLFTVVCSVAVLTCTPAVGAQSSHDRAAELIDRSADLSTTVSDDRRQAGNGSATFGQEQYDLYRGDVAEFELSEINGSELTIGLASDDSEYVLEADIEPDGDSSTVVLEWNSFYAGHETEPSLTAQAGSVTVHNETAFEAFDNRAPPGSYNLTVSVDDHVTDRATLTLTEPDQRISSPTTYAIWDEEYDAEADPGTLTDVAFETRMLTYNETLLIEYPARGVFGYLFDDDGTINRQAGLSFTTGEHGTHDFWTTWPVTHEWVTVHTNPDNERIVLAVDPAAAPSMRSRSIVSEFLVTNPENESSGSNPYVEPGETQWKSSNRVYHSQNVFEPRDLDGSTIEPDERIRVSGFRDGEDAVLTSVDDGSNANNGIVETEVHSVVIDTIELDGGQYELTDPKRGSTMQFEVSEDTTPRLTRFEVGEETVRQGNDTALELESENTPFTLAVSETTDKLDDDTLASILGTGTPDGGRINIEVTAERDEINLNLSEVPPGVYGLAATINQTNGTQYTTFEVEAPEDSRENGNNDDSTDDGDDDTGDDNEDDATGTDDGDGNEGGNDTDEDDTGEDTARQEDTEQSETEPGDDGSDPGEADDIPGFGVVSGVIAILLAGVRLHYQRQP